MRSRILFISGRHDDARQLSRMLESLPVALEHVETYQQARNRLQQFDYDVLLTEAVLPDGTWLEVLQLARDICGGQEVIVTDPQADAPFWANALNLGAYDVLSQPFYAPEVRRILSNACSRPDYQRLPAAV
jgi:DNA-binding NtrC family response regulator